MKILVPTDFSDNAHNAFEFAKKLAPLTNGSVTLLFAYHNVYDFAAQSSSITTQIEEEARKAMEELNNDRDTKIHVDFKIVQGYVATTIASTAYREDYDLIVMGTQGASGIEESLVGSNTAHVIKDSMVPVLAVPSHSSFETVKKIVVSLEWETSEQHFMERLLEITQQWEWPYRTLHVKSAEEEPSKEVVNQLESFLDQSVPGITHDTVAAENLMEGIKDYLQDADCLFAMFYKKKPFFEYLLQKSRVEKMAYHTHIPLLVVK